MALKHYRLVDYVTQAYIALVAALVLVFHGDAVAGWPPLVAGHGLVLLLLHLLIACGSRPRAHPVVVFVRHFYPLFLLPFAWREIGAVNQMFVATYQDALFVSLEQRLFDTQPAVILMDRFPYRIVGEVFYAAYFSYYIMIAGVGCALFLRDRNQFLHYLSLACFTFYACYLVYIFLPVVGARIFFHDIGGFRLPPGICAVDWPHPYPEAVEQGIMFRIMAVLYRYFEVDGAAFPSSHVAAGLCTVSFSFRYLRNIRYAHLVAFVLLCVATVYCRYHYAVDVIGGLVYGTFLLWLGNRLYQRLAS